MKIFELSSGSSLSSFLESNTRTLSSGRFVNKDKQLERFFLVLALAKYGKLPPELNTLDCLKEPQTISIYCFYFLHNYVVCKLNQGNLLLTSLQGHELQFISHKLRPLSSSYGQLRELVFFPRTEALIFLERHTRLFAEPAI